MSFTYTRPQSPEKMKEGYLKVLIANAKSRVAIYLKLL